MAALAAEAGDNERAAKLSGAADGLREAIGYKIEPAELRFRDTYMRQLRSRLSDDALTELSAAGCTLGIDAAVAETKQISATNKELLEKTS